MRTLLLATMFAVPVSAAKIVLVVGSTPQEKIVTPFGCDFDSKGRLYFVEMEKGERLRAVDDGKVVTIAGTGKKGQPVKTTKPLDTNFDGLHGLAIHREDSNVIYLADTWNRCIQRVVIAERKLVEEPIIGIDVKNNGEPMEFKSVFSVSHGLIFQRLIITDLDRHQIYAWSTDGPVHETIVAGNGKKGVPSDGAKAIEQPLSDPRAACEDHNGNVYILERGGNVLRVVNKDGIINTVAGTGKAGTAVGKAFESQMNGPKHCCCDKDGNVYIADAENHRILKYIPKEEKVILVAGTGTKGSAGLDGDPLKCELNRPHGVTVHPKSGELYICDSYNDRILKIVP